MRAQYSPGPWAWNHNGGTAFEGHLIFGNGECVGAASNDANAHLIAAAPEFARPVAVSWSQFRNARTVARNAAQLFTGAAATLISAQLLTGNGGQPAVITLYETD